MSITSGLTEQLHDPYSSKHILVIDDDNDDQVFFSEILDELKLGFTCGYASNGREGLEMMKGVPAPDVVFVDINMPVMNGFQYLEAVRREELDRNIPIIMLTTSSMKEDQELARELGAVGFISKPGSFRQFREILKDTLTSLFS